MSEHMPEWVDAVLTDVAMYLDQHGFQEKSADLLAVLDKQSMQNEFRSWDEFLQSKIEAADAKSGSSNVVYAADRFQSNVA